MLQSHSDFLKAQKQPFDNDDNYKGGNYKYVDSGKYNTTIVKCNRCGKEHRVNNKIIKLKSKIRCSCGTS